MAFRHAEALKIGDGNTQLDADGGAAFGDIAVGGGYGSGGASIGSDGGISTDGDVVVGGDLSLDAGGVNKLWRRWVSAREFDLFATSTDPIYRQYNASFCHGPVREMPDSVITTLGAFIGLPPDYDGSALTMKIYWSVLTGGTVGQVVQWNIRSNTFKDDETLDVGSSAYQLPQDAMLALEDLHIVSNSHVPGGATAGDTLLWVSVARRGSDAADTLAATADFIGLEISY